MKIISNPPKQSWAQLVERPERNNQEIEQTIRGVFQQIQLQGDEAIRYFTRLFDGVKLTDFTVSKLEFEEAIEKIPDELKNAIELAQKNIHRFHKSQIQSYPEVETMEGVTCWMKQSPISRVGLYIPGGTAPLFSSLLMLGIPALVAGCEEIIICTPPNEKGKLDPTILYVASVLGIQNVYKIGGIQAIGAMTFGSESISPVDKIFGPGNSFVTKAKEMAQPYGVAIDMPAGPSELLVIADTSCNPKYVAADLLSQAEHGIDSQVILLSNDQTIMKQCIEEIKSQLQFLPRKEMAEVSLENSKAILFQNMEECMEFSNLYAPEHLIIATLEAKSFANQVKNAGSVFIGNFSCESAGDYASGTNHTLPTNGFAKNYSGVSVDSFMKRISFQNITAKGIQNLGPSIEILAEAEGLWAHKNAVSLRLKDLNYVQN